MDTIRVKVLRAFYAKIDGEMRVMAADKIVDLPRAIAIDALTANKAERAPPETTSAPAAPPAALKTARKADKESAS